MRAPYRVRTPHNLLGACAAVGTLAGLALACVGCSGSSSGPAAILPAEPEPRLEVFGSAPDFSFPTAAGPVSKQSLLGSVWVADFFFTSCQGVCPVMTSNFADLQRVFAGRDDVKLVSFSVDPIRDTPDVLRAYAERWQAKPGKWFFVTAKAEEIEALAKEGFKLGATLVPGDILHSDRFVLVDRSGRIRGYYKGTEAESISDLIADIRTLLSEPAAK